MSEVVQTEADCPDCGNLNREARRWCKKHQGMCHGTGKVFKYVPVAVQEESSAAPD